MTSLQIFDVAMQFPDRPAIVSGDQTLTFSEVASRVRAAMRPLGGATVCQTANADVSSLVSIYAALQANTPLTLLPPKWPLTMQENWRIAMQNVELPPQSMVVFTSGSQGAPKPAVVSQQALRASSEALAQLVPWQDDDRWLLSISPAHIGGLSILTRCLAAGKTIVLTQPGRFTAESTALAVARHRVTMLSLVPSMLREMLDHGWRPPASLRKILVGGDALSPVLRRVAEDHGYPVVETYGMTETASLVALDGIVVPTAEVQIREQQIVVHGPMLFSGYVSDGKFSPRDPNAWHPTHDRGEWLVDGRLTILGRSDDVIISGGEKVDPVWVERVVCETLNLESALVFGIKDARWGQAIVLVAPDCALAFSSLREKLGAVLPSYARPRYLAAIAYPRLASGKVDRGAISRLSPEELSLTAV